MGVSRALLRLALLAPALPAGAEPVPATLTAKGEAIVVADGLRRLPAPGVVALRAAARGPRGELRVLGVTRADARRAASDALLGTDLVLLSSRSPGEPRVLEGRPRVVDARLSPDGELVAIWTRELAVELREAASGEPRMTLEGAVDPCFSPCGRWLFVARCARAPAAFPGPLRIEAIDLSGGEPIPWTDGVDDSRPRPLPGGALLFTSGARSGRASFYLLDRPGGTPRALFRGRADGLDPPTSDGSLAISPHRDRLAWCAPGAGAPTLWWADLDSGELRELGPGRQPGFSAAGELVARRPGADGAERLVIASGADPTRFRPLAADLAPPADPLRRIPAGSGAGSGPARELPAPPPHPPRGPDPVPSTTFRFPLSYHPGYTAYYDNDAGAGVLDWKCGGFSYNGHRGTDIGAPRWTHIYAGADGLVSMRCDGFGEGWPGNTDCGGFGNMIRLDHGDGQTIYAHMQAGTPTQASALACGDEVGRSGNSGNSSGPHLHFEVLRYGYPLDDPFAGTCSGPESFWTDQNMGWPTDECEGDGGVVVVDNDDPNFRMVGPPDQWWLATGWGYGGSTRWTWNISSMPYENAAAWLFDTAARSYQVQVHIPANYATTGSAHYYLRTTGGWQGPHQVDQSRYFDEWVSLGRFEFKSGRNIVAVVDVTGEAYGSTRVAADACRIVP